MIYKWLKSSTLLIIREMQVKTAMKYYFIPFRMAMIQKEKGKLNKIRVGESVDK
jgi:hypothetical protein